MNRALKTLTVLFLLIISVVPIGLPVSAAIHTYYLGNSTVGSCSGLCESLPTTTGTADSATTQSISTTTGNFKIEPDTSSSATGTPGSGTPSGYSWETSSAIGGQIASGIWSFDLTVGSSASTGTAQVWITVWSCQTSSEGTCAFLFKNWDNTTNVISTTAAKTTYTTGTIGPFTNVQFLVVEYWLHVTVAGASGETVSETTVSSASDVNTPGFQYSFSLPESPTVSDALSRLRGHSFPVADTSLFSDSVSQAMKSTRAVLDNFPFATSLSTFASLVRRASDSFAFNESVPSSKKLINSFEMVVKDTYAYSDTAARTARNSAPAIVAIIDLFAFGDQIGSGGSSNPPGFFGDLANRVATGFSGLTGGSTALSPTVLAFSMIAALAAVIAIFVGRRRGTGGVSGSSGRGGRGGCNVITLAIPPCRKYGGRHQCGSRSGHMEAHKCKCGASW